MRPSKELKKLHTVNKQLSLKKFVRELDIPIGKEWFLNKKHQKRVRG